MAKKQGPLSLDLMIPGKRRESTRSAPIRRGTIERNARGGKTFVPSVERYFTREGHRGVKRTPKRAVEFQGVTYYVDAAVVGDTE